MAQKNMNKFVILEQKLIISSYKSHRQREHTSNLVTKLYVRDFSLRDIWMLASAVSVKLN